MDLTRLHFRNQRKTAKPPFLVCSPAIVAVYCTPPPHAYPPVLSVYTVHQPHPALMPLPLSPSVNGVANQTPPPIEMNEFVMFFFLRRIAAPRNCGPDLSARLAGAAAGKIGPRRSPGRIALKHKPLPVASRRALSTITR